MESIAMGRKILEDGLIEKFNVQELASIIRAFNSRQCEPEQPEYFEFSDLEELGERLEEIMQARKAIFEVCSFNTRPVPILLPSPLAA